MATLAPPTASQPMRGGPLPHALKRWLAKFAHMDRVAAASIVVIVVLAFLALFGPYLAPHDPNAVDLGAAYQSPTASHLLGTDASGRDLLSRILAGARPSLLGPFLVMVLATSIGTGVAVASAWIGGRFDAVVARTLDVLFAFPGLLLALLAVAMFGPGLAAPVIALAIANIPWVARIVRSVAARERRLPYIVALEVQGFSSIAIARRHLIPNVSATIAAQSALTFAYAMVDLAAINFLGLGVQPPTSDWGVMVSEGQDAILRSSPEESLVASAFIVITVLAVTLLSYRLGADQRGAQPG